MTIGRIPSVEGGIQPTIVDAKGDLIAATAADTVNRLAVGSNDQVLVADSSASTGLAWKSYGAQVVAGKNFIINGGFDIWQRGTSGFSTSNATYTADRWQNSSNNLTITRDTDVPTSPYFNYSMKMVGTAANSVIQRIESANSTLLAGQNITVSFYAKRTSGTGNLDVRFYYPSATDNFASVTQIGSTVVLSASPSSSWTRYSTTVAIGTNVTAGLQILINNDTSSGGTTFITGVQLEIGSVATPFSRAGGTIQGELAACMRYYWRSESGSAQQKFTQGPAYSTTSVLCNPITLPSPMRVKPTAVDYGGTIWLQQHAGAGGNNVTSIAIDGDYTNTKQVVLIASVASGLTAGTIYELKANSSSTAYIGLSAEL
jgi:hypothetical protein